MTRTLPAAGRHRVLNEPATSGPGSLVAMILIAAALGVVLWVISGPPSAAWYLPDFATVRETLAGSEINDRDLVAAATAVAWLLLAYLAIVVSLRAAAVAAERATRGARWARVALQITNLTTIPAVRRIVDGGVAGTLVVASWMPATARIAVAAEPAAIVALPPPAVVAEAGGPAPWYAAEQAERWQAVSYTVVRGDDLWGIAKRFYDDGSRYVDLFEANRDRIMANGERFTDPRVVRVGWVLHVPLPSPRIAVEAGTPVYHVIRGDHLWGIAERLLGDGFRWPEIWEANRDRDMGEGWRFVDPNLIYPGWQLEVPADVLWLPAVADEPVAPQTPEPTTTPEPVATPAASSFPETEPAVVGDAAEETEGGSGIAWDWPSIPRPLLVTAAGFAVLGTAVLFVTRAHRAGLLRVPAFVRRDARRTGDAGRVTLVARALAATIADLGHANARLVLVRETERALTCTVDCSADDADALIAAAPELAVRLGCEVEGTEAAGQCVDLILADAGELTMRIGDEAAVDRALMLPVGTDMAERITYLNLAGTGSAVVSGLDAERRELLHSWLATLASTTGADGLALRADEATALLMGDDLWLPHFGGADCPDTGTLVEELEDLIQSREGTDAHRPVVAVLNVGVGEARHDAIVPYARDAGVYLVGVALPGRATDRDEAIFGASVLLGVDTAVEGGDDGGIDQGSLSLTVGTGEPVRLDPVLVRRDTSARWREPRVAAQRSEPPRADEVRSDTPEGGRASAKARPGTFDWHGALFEPSGIADGFAKVSADEGALRRDDPATDATADPSVDLDRPSPSHLAEERSDAVAFDSGSDVADETPAVAEAWEVADGDDLQVHSERGPLPTAPVDHDEAGPAPQLDPPIVPELAEADPAIDESAAEVTTVASGAAPVHAPLQDDLEQVQVPESRSPTARQQPLFLAESRPTEANANVGEDEALITVQCLGDFEVFVAGKPLTWWRYEKGREFVALLVAYGGAAVPRTVVANALWPDQLWDTSTKHLMSTAATTVRKTIREAGERPDLQPLTLTRDRYQFQPGILRSDLDEFESALRQAMNLPAVDALGHYERAVALYRGDIMQSETFEWLDQYRMEYRKRFVEAVLTAGEHAIQLGEVERAVRLYLAGTERVPTDEAIARGLMRCLGTLGDHAGVLKVYRVLTEALQRELNTPRATPSTETRALLEELTAEAAVG